MTVVSACSKRPVWRSASISEKIPDRANFVGYDGEGWAYYRDEVGGRLVAVRASKALAVVEKVPIDIEKLTEAVIAYMGPHVSADALREAIRQAVEAQR